MEALSVTTALQVHKQNSMVERTIYQWTGWIIIF